MAAWLEGKKGAALVWDATDGRSEGAERIAETLIDTEKFDYRAGEMDWGAYAFTSSTNDGFSLKDVLLGCSIPSRRNGAVCPFALCCKMPRVRW